MPESPLMELSAPQRVVLSNSQRRQDMDKDRIEGSLEQAKGKVKEVAGKVTGDAKLEGEGKADQAAGKVQNAVGGIKDALRGK
jgi:uncharacterized protein YjbJ (UPF0337 family)